MTHYAVLGIAEDAALEEVRQAYRRLVKAAHPDAAGDAARFRLITEAYVVLSDPIQRRAYDRTLGTGWATAPPARRRRHGRYGLVLVVALVVAGAVGLLAATTGLSRATTASSGRGGASQHRCSGRPSTAGLPTSRWR